MYKGLRKIIVLLGAVLLLGACGQPAEQTESAGITDMPTEHPVATVAPMEKPTSGVTPEVTNMPEVEAMATPEPMGTVAPIEPCLSPTPEAVDTPVPTLFPDTEPAKVGMDGVLVDNELCKIQAVLLEKGEYYYVLCLLIENRTEKALKLYVGDVYVNRIECCEWDCEVPAGATIEEELTLYGVEKYVGVTDLSDITELYLPLEIYDEREAWMDIFERSQEGYWPEPIFQQVIYYYPQGEELYVPYTHERLPEDIVVVDNEELTLLIIGDVYTEDGGYEINLFLENHTDKRVWYEFDELALNGFLCEPFYEWKCDFYPGTGAYGTIEYLDCWKDETEGDTITETSFLFSAASLDYDYHFSEEFTVYLQGEELAQEYEYVQEERDVILYDGPEALLALTGIELAEEAGKTVCVATAHVENKAEETLYIRCEGLEETVPRAGEYLSDTWNDYVTGGKKRKVELKWYQCWNDWEEQGRYLVDLPIRINKDIRDSYENETIFNEVLTIWISEEAVGLVAVDE